MNRADIEGFLDKLIDQDGGDVGSIIWTTRDGDQMPMRRMTAQHLEFATQYFKREIRMKRDQAEILDEALFNSGPNASDFLGALEDLESDIDRTRVVLALLQREKKRRTEAGLTNETPTGRLRERIRQREASHAQLFT